MICRENRRSLIGMRRRIEAPKEADFRSARHGAILASPN
jgi:hypothetical protein